MTSQKGTPVVDIYDPGSTKVGAKSEEASSESTESVLSAVPTPEASHPFLTAAATPAQADVSTGDMQWSFEALPDEFHKSPEPLTPRVQQQKQQQEQQAEEQQNHHQLHLKQIQENALCREKEQPPVGLSPARSMPEIHGTVPDRTESADYFTPHYTSTHIFCQLSRRIFRNEEFAVATWIGFWSLLVVTMGVSTITPIRDAVALQVGVKHMPKLTLASSVLAFLSSVPIGWLFEAPDPGRRKLWKTMGLTRGETQGSSLALFYRFFALAITSYAIGFTLVDLVHAEKISLSWFSRAIGDASDNRSQTEARILTLLPSPARWVPLIVEKLGEIMYIAFFLVVHLMKLHSISLVWGVTTEAMEYEDVAREAKEHKDCRIVKGQPVKRRTRLQRLSLVGFGGTLGGIVGR